ncbi:MULTISPECIES: hypothetical protein [Halorussus]|nr:MULTISPECIES: hypothetical protein [Halorussus]NHN59311.1 hypothetical protein [Halorussus sp. JP-T4]
MLADSVNSFSSCEGVGAYHALYPAAGHCDVPHVLGALDARGVRTENTTV